MSNAVSDKKILVTGSTGATGTPTVKLLIERGFAVRAQVRRQDHRSATLESLGAEIVEGDLLNLSNVREMLAGVHSAFFIFPMRPDFLDATSYFAQAAAEAKLDAIVNLSQRTASDTSESHIARNHWMSERVFDQFPTPTVHLRPTFFADWFLYFTDMVKAGAYSSRSLPIASTPPPPHSIGPASPRPCSLNPNRTKDKPTSSTAPRS